MMASKATWVSWQQAREAAASVALDGETQHAMERIATLEALLRRWVDRHLWATSIVGMDRTHYTCALCGRDKNVAYATVDAIPHVPGCIVGYTLKALEATDDDATE